MRTPLLALLVLAAACASGPALTRGSEQTVLAGGPTIRRSATEPAPQDSLALPPTEALRALMRAYESVGIPVTLVDPKKQVIGNPNFVVIRTLAGAPMSRFVSCGMGMTGENADVRRIYLALITAAAPTPKGSVVETRIQAESQDITGGASMDRIPCETTGELEAELHRRARGLY